MTAGTESLERRGVLGRCCASEPMWPREYEWPLMPPPLPSPFRYQRSVASSVLWISQPACRPSQASSHGVSTNRVRPLRPTATDLIVMIRLIDSPPFRVASGRWSTNGRGAFPRSDSLIWSLNVNANLTLRDVHGAGTHSDTTRPKSLCNSVSERAKFPVLSWAPNKLCFPRMIPESRVPGTKPGFRTGLERLNRNTE